MGWEVYLRPIAQVKSVYLTCGGVPELHHGSLCSCYGNFGYGKRILHPMARVESVGFACRGVLELHHDSPCSRRRDLGCSKHVLRPEERDHQYQDR